MCQLHKSDSSLPESTKLYSPSDVAVWQTLHWGLWRFTLLVGIVTKTKKKFDFYEWQQQLRESLCWLTQMFNPVKQTNKQKKGSRCCSPLMASWRLCRQAASWVKTAEVLLGSMASWRTPEQSCLIKQQIVSLHSTLFISRKKQTT